MGKSEIDSGTLLAALKHVHMTQHTPISRWHDHLQMMLCSFEY